MRSKYISTLLSKLCHIELKLGHISLRTYLLYSLSRTLNIEINGLDTEN